MNPHGDGKPEARDPDEVLRLLDLELAQSRIAREQAGVKAANHMTATK